MKFGKLCLTPVFIVIAGICSACTEMKEGDQFYIGISSSYLVDVYVNNEPVIISETGQFFEDITVFIKEGENYIEATIRADQPGQQHRAEIVIARGVDIQESELVFSVRDIVLENEESKRIEGNFEANDLDFRTCFLEQADEIYRLQDNDLRENVYALIQQVFEAYEQFDFSALDDLLYASNDCYWEVDQEVRDIERNLVRSEMQIELSSLEDLELFFGEKTVLVMRKEGGAMIQSYRHDHREFSMPRIELEKLWVMKVASQWYVVP